MSNKEEAHRRAAGPRAGPTMRTRQQGEKTDAPGAVFPPCFLFRVLWLK